MSKNKEEKITKPLMVKDVIKHIPTPGVSAPRPKKEELVWRYGVVYELYLWGYTEIEIQRLVNNGGLTRNNPEYYWGISLNTIKKYKYKGVALHAKKVSEKFTTEDLYKRSTARWDSLIKKAFELGSLDNARLCQKELDALNGLDGTGQVLKIQDLRGKTDSELIAEYERIKKLNEQTDEK